MAYNSYDSPLFAQKWDLITADSLQDMAAAAVMEAAGGGEMVDEAVVAQAGGAVAAP
jgi:lactate dehydrogenase-like 2-hydroxyacid dehydrogenase